MTKDRGFIGLVTVITVSAIAVLITSATLLRSITESTISMDEEHSAQAWAAANGCVEYALTRYASTTGDGWGSYDADYSPNDDELSIGENPCYIVEVDGANSGTSTTRTIKTESRINDFYRRLEVTISTNTPSLEVDSWTEVADFNP